MNLYEINTAIQDCIDEDSGEILDFERLQNLQMQYDEKIENVALAYKNALAEAEALKNEKKAFEEREKKAKNRADYLIGYLGYVLDGQPFKTTRVEIKFRKSEAVIVPDDVTQLPEEYLTYKDPTANKTKIKEALKSGELIPGCSIEQRKNISVK